MITTAVPSIFLEIRITFNELIEVLTKLGYHPEFDGKHNLYINEKYKSMVKMPVHNLDELMERADVAAYSSRLYLQGVIKEEEDLIRKIQKNRLKKSKNSGNKGQASA